MRAAFAEAVHHCRHRKAFGAFLVDQELMTRVLADMALDALAAAALSFRLAESYDRADVDPPVVTRWETISPGAVGEYRIDLVERTADGYHVIVGDARRGVRVGLWLHRG